MKKDKKNEDPHFFGIGFWSGISFAVSMFMFFSVKNIFAGIGFLVLWVAMTAYYGDKVRKSCETCKTEDGQDCRYCIRNKDADKNKILNDCWRDTP